MESIAHKKQRIKDYFMIKRRLKLSKSEFLYWNKQEILATSHKQNNMTEIYSRENDCVDSIVECYYYLEQILDNKMTMKEVLEKQSQLRSARESLEK